MQTPHPVPTAAAAALAAAALVALSAPSLVARGQATSPGSAGPWTAFGADLSIRQSVLAVDGQPPGPAAPAATLRLDRRLDRGRWRTTMTLKSMERPQIRGLAGTAAIVNPFEIVRMEYDEDGTAPRLYDRQGRLVRLPGEADRRLLHTPAALAAGLPAVQSLEGRVGIAPPGLTTHAWIAEVMAARELRLTRRAALERRFGAASGKVRGLDRFVGWLGADGVEVLVDPGDALPVEITTARNGEVRTRTTIGYTRDAAGTLVRRTVRAERDRGDGSGERTVTDIDLANIQATRGGAR
jgi:hypothetical protein